MVWLCNGTEHIGPFSLIDIRRCRIGSIPVDCPEPFSMFDHCYLIIRVLRLFSILIDLLIDLWACLISRLRFHADPFSSDRG